MCVVDRWWRDYLQDTDPPNQHQYINMVLNASTHTEPAHRARRAMVPRPPPHPPPCYRRLLPPKHRWHCPSLCSPRVVAAPAHLPCALSLSHARATLKVDLVARRAPPRSPTAPLLPSTLAAITRSGPCSTRSTAPTSVPHGTLPLHRHAGRATPEAVCTDGWASPLLPVTPLLPSLPGTVTKSGSYSARFIVVTYACRAPPPALRRHTGHRGGLPWWLATIQWSPDLGLRAQPSRA
jgi:hypothetical protein